MEVSWVLLGFDGGLNGKFMGISSNFHDFMMTISVLKKL